VARYRADVTPSSADYSVSCDLYVASTLSNRAGVSARQAPSANTRYFARYSRVTAGVELFKTVSGTSTQLGSTSSQTASAGNTYRLELIVNGTTIEAYWDGGGSPVVSQTDSAITDAGHPGIVFLNAANAGNTTGIHIDNWSVDTLGGASHDADGALSAQSATVSGSSTAVTTFTSSGALSAQAATVAGTANHVTTHASSGVLEAQAATVAGSADHSAAGAFSATGALTAQAATVAGSAAHLTLHTATGALAADSATAAGAAVHYTLHTATGDLVADAASVSGVALHEGDGAEVAKPFTGAGKPRRTRQRVVVEIDGDDFIAESPEEAQAILDQAKEAAEEKAKVAVERATKARNRPTRKVMADARKALELPAISAPDLGGYAEEISRQIEDIYQSAIQTIEVAALLRKRELEEEDDEDILLLIA